MKKYGLSKHDKTIQCIVEKLSSTNHWDLVGCNLEYFVKKTFQDGEIDFFAVNLDKKYALIGEVKTSHSPHNYVKALYQLSKDEEYILQEYGMMERIFKFYATHSENEKGYNIKRVE